MNFIPNYSPKVQNLKFYIYFNILYIIFLSTSQVTSVEQNNFPLTNISPGLYALQLSIGYPMHDFLLLVDTSMLGIMI
jgi:hypothetical protein